METFLKDVRYALRGLLKRPAFTAIVVITLALAIGANTGIFSVVNAVLLRPLPFTQPTQLVMVWGETRGEGPQQRGVWSYPNFADLLTQTQTLQGAAAYTNSGVTLTGRAEPEFLRGATVSAGLFPMLNVRPLLGRAFTREDDQPNSAPVVVLSHAVWQQRFGSDPNIIGRELTLSGRSTTVIGVMPTGFKFPLNVQQSDYWLPLGSDLTAISRVQDRGNQFLRIVARVKSEASIEHAQAELSTIARRLETQYPNHNTGLGVRVVTLHEDMSSSCSW